MTKAWICVLDSEDQTTHSAIVDLEKLPPGANANRVALFDAQGIDIGKDLQSDIARASALINGIARSQYTPEALRLISDIASFVENAPPADQDKDLLIAVTAGSAHILRTSPEVAERAWSGMKSAGKNA